MEKLKVNLDTFYNSPELFLEPSKEFKDDFIKNSKMLYDFMQDVDLNYFSKTNSLKELLTTGFDNEQIWQELELQNGPLLKGAKKIFHELKQDKQNIFGKYTKMEEKKKVKFKSLELEDRSSSDDEGQQEEKTLEDEDIDSDLELDMKNSHSVKKYKPSIVDDKFFKLREMEEFLDNQDKLEDLQRDGNLENDKDDQIDLFENMDSDDNDGDPVEDIRYQEFYSAPEDENDSKDVSSSKISKSNILEDYDDIDMDDNEYETKQDNKNTDEEENEESETDNHQEIDKESNMDIENMSKFERSQLEIKRKINRLEEANLSDKPWQLLGETTARARPVNSLLEEHVSFDHTSVGAPVITEETTQTLEDLIKQRIKDQAWDDVERKQKPSNQPFEYKKAPELNQEKSKLSLAEVYEKEYLKQQEEEKEDKENEDHVLIKQLMDKLFVKLDALSNFQFTPKPPQPELKIISNTPSLQMEEITPITISETTQLAPEEIYNRKKGDIKGESEKTDTDRKHERRQKKIKKKFAVQETERKEKLKLKSGKVVKSSKKKVIDQLKKNSRNAIVDATSTSDKNVKSSNAFFNKLQDEVRQGIDKKKVKSNKEKKKPKKSTQSFKL